MALRFKMPEIWHPFVAAGLQPRGRRPSQPHEVTGNSRWPIRRPAVFRSPKGLRYEKGHGPRRSRAGS
ncbi:hypothetical protein SAMN02745206_03411 [Desulfacinum infernum DSM 9756]|uniref:Uncharacterized protein n=1 Tax=Desulfacinum infernum DSM 9756 TaxID=1121391 RepID=A0A1M5HQ93_9BACT|nr:hypothetical protein SAMN02745206_03411 [Desulfacinum infernum DSM 9756]